MPNTIAEQITQNLITTLRGVSRGNGASLDLHVVDQDNDSEARIDGLCVVIPDDPELLESPLGWRQIMQPYMVVVFLQRSEKANSAFRNRMSAAIGDIHKALKIDPTRGSLAIHTFIEPHETAIDGEFDRLIFRPRVLFRHLIDDPFSQGGS